MSCSYKGQGANSTGFGIRQRWISPGFSTYQLCDLVQPPGLSFLTCKMGVMIPPDRAVAEISDAKYIVDGSPGRAASQSVT